MKLLPSYSDYNVARLDAPYHEKWLHGIPDKLRSRLVREYERRRDGVRCAHKNPSCLQAENQGRAAANQYLRELVTGNADRVVAAGELMHSGRDDHEQLSIWFARQWERAKPAPDGREMAALATKMQKLGIGMPGPECSEEGAVLRLGEPGWWRRRLRVAHARAVDSLAQHAGWVRKGRGKYVSDDALQLRRQAIQRQRRMIEAMQVRPEGEGDEVALELQAIVAASLANPANRRAELMARIAGTEQYATEAGHAAVLWTITAPSRFHRTSKGDDNPNWIPGITPEDARAHLNGVWQRTRAAWQRAGLLVYGYPITEPHADGCPHRHILAWMPRSDVRRASAILREKALGFVKPHFGWSRKLGRYVKPGTGICWLDCDGGERGAAKYRFDCERIDRRRGSATAYVAKYIAKNIDGHGMDAQGELFESHAAVMAERVLAWATTWRQRQFNAFGLPPVGVWRELRRLREPVADPLLESARLAADAGDYAEFLRVMGGPGRRRAEYPIFTHRQDVGRLNRYGEPVGAEVLGVQSIDAAAPEPTRVVRWVIEKKPACKRRADASRAGDSPPWSPVNNCTAVAGEVSHERRTRIDQGDAATGGFGVESDEKGRNRRARCGPLH